LRWWEKFWADAYAGYYRWQYKFLQTEIAPKLGKKHLFVGGNSKLCWSSGAWDYYAFSWNPYDLLGPNETSVVYSDKHATGFKLALAASNGKPGALWSAQGSPALAGSEALATLGVLNNMPEHLMGFHKANRDLYHNAMPGARVAAVYHLEDGLHHGEIANFCRVTDQVWRSGTALEVLTEKHLAEQILKDFDVVIVPGFRFTKREVATLKAYAEAGGKLLLIGDNTNISNTQLSEAIARIPPFTNAEKKIGRGAVMNFPTQLITQEAMTNALQKLGGFAYRIESPANENLLLNVLTQPGKFTTVHLVNFTGKPVKNVTVKLPDNVRAEHVAWVSPYGGHASVTARNGRLIAPELSVYGIFVLCEDAATRDAVLARSRSFAHKLTYKGRKRRGKPISTPEGHWPTIKIRGDMPNKQISQKDLKKGDKLCYLRSFSKTGFRRLDADIVMQGTGSVGEAVPVKLKIHAVGVWAPKFVHIDKFAFVFVREEDGVREALPVPMKPVTGKDGGVEERQIKNLQMPAGTFVNRDSAVAWVPKQPGRYQAFLSYRYVDEVFTGGPDTSVRKRTAYRRDEFYFAKPFLKMVYEDRLPCMVVDVKK